MDLVALFKDFGPWVALVVYFVWRDWQREKRMAKRLDMQWDELAKLSRQVNGILRELTSVLRARPCLADDCDLEPHPAPPVPQVPQVGSDSDSHRTRPGSILPELAAALVLVAVLCAAGCDAPERRDDLPPAPPAAAEVADLRAQEVEAATAAAHATAAGDTARADYLTRLAAELGKLRAAADERARVQAAAMAAMRDESERAAQARAEAATAAHDRRRARVAAVVGSALCVTAGGLGVYFGAARLALALSAAGILGCFTLYACAEATRAAWIAPALGAALIAGIAWVLIRRRDSAIVATAHLGDALEQGLGVMERKARAKAAQVSAGVHRLVQAARGKQA